MVSSAICNPAIHLITNPAAGGYCPDKIKKIAERFHQLEIRPKLHKPASEAAARRLVAELSCLEGSPIIVAVGGDGTFATVLNSMQPDRARIALIPLGTANVLARELGICGIHDAVTRICTLLERPIQVGRATTDSDSSLFVLMAGIGFDGQAVHTVRPREKQLLGIGAYILAGIRSLYTWSPPLLTVQLQEDTYQASTLVLTNCSRYGGPFRLTSFSGLFGGGLSMITFKAQGPFALLAAMFRQVMPTALRQPRVPVSQSLQVQGIAPIQLDGDPFGRSPVTIDILTNYVRLIC